MNNTEYVARQRQRLENSDESRFVAQQVLTLFQAAADRPGAVCLELGTDTGQGTKAMLAGCEESGGRLCSVDIRDCSGAGTGDRWTFVQASSLDRETVLAAAPYLAEGIDIIYVDSLHTADHVQKEVFTWYDLLKPGGQIFFDDIDSGPYLRGQRKDNASIEIANRLIRERIESIFLANLGALDLQIVLGSTGIAIMTKRAAMGAKLHPPLKCRPRRSKTLARIAGKLGLRRYHHTGGPTD